MTQSESLDNRPSNCDKTKYEDCQNWCKHLKLKTKNTKNIPILKKICISIKCMLN